MLPPPPFILKKRQNCYYFRVCSLGKNTQEQELTKEPNKREGILQKEV